MNADKKPTSTEVARLAGVSQATVSLVLNDRMDIKIPDSTRARVKQAALDLCYTPLGKRHDTVFIGVVVPTLTNSFYPKLISDIEEAAEEYGLHILALDSHRSLDEESLCLQYLRHQKLFGAIITYTPFSRENLRAFAAETPVIIMGEEDDSLQIDTLSFNSFKAGEMLTNHLISLGHKNIGFISTPTQQTSWARVARLQGYRKAMADASLDNNTHIFVDPADYEVKHGDYEVNAGFRLGQTALAQGGITAVICVNDTVASGMIQAAWLSGKRVPEDIAVAGFDNLLLSTMLTPPLTSVDHHTFERARLAIDMLRQKRHGRSRRTPINVAYSPTLMIRASTDSSINAGRLLC